MERKAGGKAGGKGAARRADRDDTRTSRESPVDLPWFNHGHHVIVLSKACGPITVTRTVAHCSCTAQCATYEHHYRAMLSYL